MSPASLQTIQRVLELTVHRRYQDLEDLTAGRRLRAMEIEAGVLEYGRTLVMPPGEPRMDVVPVLVATVPTWAVTIDLWSAEEGRSDLSLELNVMEHDDRTVVEIGDLHVL